MVIVSLLTTLSMCLPGRVLYKGLRSPLRTIMNGRSLSNSFLVFSLWIISWVVLISHQRANYPLDTDVNWTYIRRWEDAGDVFWRSYARSIYVLCPGSSNHLSHIFKMIWLLQKCCAYCEEAVYHYELIILRPQHLIKYNFKLRYHIMNKYL